MWKHIYVEVIDWVGLGLTFRFYFNGQVIEGGGNAIPQYLQYKNCDNSLYKYLVTGKCHTFKKSGISVIIIIELNKLLWLLK